MKCSRPRCQRAADYSRKGMCQSCHQKQLRNGIGGRRDATPAVEHIVRLRDLGWTWGQIGEAIGNQSGAVPWRLFHGENRMVLASTLDEVLAIPLMRPQGTRRQVNAIGTRRRLQALSYMGWTRAAVADAIDYNMETMRNLHQTGTVSTQLAHAVADFYEAHSHLWGGSRMTAGKARSRGYAPPLAWDDSTIDNPAAKPQGLRRSA